MAYNNKNYVVTWPAYSTTALYTGSLNQSYLNKPIPLVSSNAIPNVPSYTFNLPTNNLRHITFESTNANVVFNITGVIETTPSYKLPIVPSIVTETVTCTTANTIYQSVNSYKNIISIVPTALPTNIVDLSIGYSAAGVTAPFVADVWKGVNNYSVAFTNVQNQSLSLNYSLDYINYFTANITQPPFVVSPTALVNPITQNGIVSFINIPLASIQIAVTGNGSFTTTIMQQGASY